MDTKIAKKYSPKDFETNVYNNWEELGFFKPVD
jgi:hypothetical protein